MPQTDAYGDHILRTGGLQQTWEHCFNSYIFSSRFPSVLGPILDLGPGRCEFTRLDPSRIVAVDNSPTLVNHYTKEGLDIRLGSADALPFPDASLSGAYSCWLLEHLTRPEDCFRELHRVLVPGGYACLIVPSAESLLHGFYDDYTHVRPFTRLSLAQLANAAGFSTHSVEYLFWTRGSRQVLRYGGERMLGRYLRFADRVARRGGLVNRYNLSMSLWR
jgi:SAM-dependent methyltransferase